MNKILKTIHYGCALFPAILLIGCSHQGVIKNQDKPNIILVMADDQGWGDMGYNGHPVLKTPNFDKMAADGLQFDRFYSAAPVCSPTRGSVLTGRHPNRFGCFSWGKTLRPQEITVAEALKTVGYTTGHFGKWHLGSVRKGSPINPGNSGFDEWLSAPNFFDNDPVLSLEGKAVQKYGESSMVTADAAIEFMRNHSNDKEPFFAVVWFGSPHTPYSAIEEDRELYRDQLPLDGISITPLLDNKMETRIKPMGFWQYTPTGKKVSSVNLMAELLKEQEEGVTEIDFGLLDINAGDISIKYPEGIYPGHAAWLDWPYKLHRIHSEDDNVLFELYNLESDPDEKVDLFSSKAEIVKTMKTEIEVWLKSVVSSLNGEDYN